MAETANAILFSLPNIYTGRRKALQYSSSKIFTENKLYDYLHESISNRFKFTNILLRDSNANNLKTLRALR